MATIISPTDRRVIIEGVSWETYERLLEDFGDSHAVRVAFDRGTLEIMAPSFAHERPSHLLALIVDLIALEWSLDLEAAGSTTFKREDVERGFEPDAAFYIGPETGAKFIQGAPIFAVEVRSEGDYGPHAEQFRMRLQLQLTHVQEQAARDLSNSRIQLAAEVAL